MPPPPMRTRVRTDCHSRPLRSESMFGDDVWRAMKALGGAATAAGTDPARCVIFTGMFESVLATLTAQHLRDEPEQEDFLVLTEPGVGEDRSLNIGDRWGVDGQPAEVA